MTDSELAAFLRGEADHLELEADAIDLLHTQTTFRLDPVAVHYCQGAAFSLRNIARSYRERVPTEEHEWDCTIADLVDLETVEVGAFQ